MKTDALVVDYSGAAFSYRQISVEDEPRDDEVLVEIYSSGLCHTDLNFSKETDIPGLFPAVFGHEGAGVVLKTGVNVQTTRPGDHVILTYSCCTNCNNCHSKETSFCDHFETLNFGVGRMDGSKAYFTSTEPVTSHFFGQSSFAKFTMAMASSVVKVDESLPLHFLAPLGCGVMTGAGALLNVLQPKKDAVLCITGAGTVGLAALMAVKLLPYPPSEFICVDIVPSRLELAKKFGATILINSQEEPDLVVALKHATNGRGVDGSIDTTGRPQVAGSLLKATAKKGTVVQVGVGLLTAEVSASMFDTVNSGRIYRGCAMGNGFPQEFLPKLIGAWQDGLFPFTDLVQSYPAEEIAEAVEAVNSGRVIKAVLTWDKP
ncbi:hypothetical protein BFJ69_g7829 [Fusarium oxysporum]|uniref:Enoyl reductase (ER) domain-containing protein n=1 Tax=Fusarium oxysporum TaxID=5507 RepID=A0A420N4Q4_FUSOX|nr:hypothetical protein BFJ69_g7829 [Fusarium oxysporum]